MEELDSESDNQEESNFETNLEKFRAQWKAEIIQRKSSPVTQKTQQSPTTEQDDIYQKAKEVFLNGVWCEQNGLIYEAMEYYRRATKIVPDIDIKMAAHFRQTHVTAQEKPCMADGETDTEDDIGPIDDLCCHFTNLCTESADRMSYCTSEEPQRTTHISSLPAEVLIYVLYWIVSTDLDVQSLEKFSMVCRGFYLVARDPQIWQAICKRVWGSNCCSHHPYSTWRLMYIERPHLHYNGVYMNKVELMRQGEATLEKFYPPWMKVVYYRYMKFFPDGMMCMYTSAEDPATVVGQLRSPTALLEGMCRGMYRISNDNQITCILKRVKVKENRSVYKRHKKRGPEPADGETTFLIDLTLHSVGSRPNCLLNWEKYSLSVYYPDSPSETSSDFKLTKQDFPPLQFARVKKYTAFSEKPLAIG